MPNLEELGLGRNPIGDLGVAALAAPLRKHQSLTRVYLWGCEMGDEGAASLIKGLGMDDFKRLQSLDLDRNHLTDKICAPIVEAIYSGAMPKLVEALVSENDVSAEAREAVQEALDATAPNGFARSYYD